MKNTKKTNNGTGKRIVGRTILTTIIILIVMLVGLMCTSITAFEDTEESGLSELIDYIESTDSEHGQLECFIERKNIDSFDDFDSFDDTENIKDIDVEKLNVFTVANTRFSRNINKEKLCTQWRIHSSYNPQDYDPYQYNDFCSGYEKCCEIIGLSRISDKWDNEFELYNLMYNEIYSELISELSEYEDIKVSSRIILLDYDLGIEKYYFNIDYSDWKSLSVIR